MSVNEWGSVWAARGLDEAGTIRWFRDPTQAVVAIEDDIAARLSSGGRRFGAHDAVVGHTDAIRGDLDVRLERSAWASRL